MPETAQHALWNGPSGRAWIEAERVLDPMFAPFATLLANAMPADQPARVLDVGCGTGAVSLKIASRLGSGGHCTGVDISTPLITRAIKRAASAGLPVDFRVGDAQRLALLPASFDRIVSRFGVMFFDDPVMALANLRQATRSGGSLHAIAWRSATENPFMTAAERATAHLLTLPARVADAPGQFAFADRERVIGILTDAGWQDIEVVARVSTYGAPRSSVLLTLMVGSCSTGRMKAGAGLPISAEGSTSRSGAPDFMTPYTISPSSPKKNSTPMTMATGGRGREAGRGSDTGKLQDSGTTEAAVGGSDKATQCHH